MAVRLASVFAWNSAQKDDEMKRKLTNFSTPFLFFIFSWVGEWLLFVVKKTTCRQLRG